MCVIFSRDKTYLKETTTENDINVLLQCANLMEDSVCTPITTENIDGNLYLLKNYFKLFNHWSKI